MSYWYNVDTGKVETDENRSRGELVLGPYATEEEARRAIETANARTEKWDEEDRAWRDKGTSGTRWDDEDIDD
ncbi:hypothetical protein GCM10027053_03550 [Intrasporangium mesophilum]